MLHFLELHVTQFGSIVKIYSQTVYIFGPGNESNRQETHNRETE